MSRKQVRKLLFQLHPSAHLDCGWGCSQQVLTCDVPLQVSVGSEVLPPWKQGGYVAEAVSSVSSVSSTTQLHVEKLWEQQITASREVRSCSVIQCRG